MQEVAEKLSRQADAGGNPIGLASEGIPGRAMVSSIFFTPRATHLCSIWNCRVLQKQLRKATGQVAQAQVRFARKAAGPIKKTRQLLAARPNADLETGSRAAERRTVSSVRSIYFLSASNKPAFA